MNTCKINYNDKMVEIQLSMDEEEIEKNEIVSEDTLDLSNEIINEENK